MANFQLRTSAAPGSGGSTPLPGQRRPHQVPGVPQTTSHAVRVLPSEGAASDQDTRVSSVHSALMHADGGAAGRGQGGGSEGAAARQAARMAQMAQEIVDAADVATGNAQTDDTTTQYEPHKGQLQWRRSLLRAMVQAGWEQPAPDHAPMAPDGTIDMAAAEARRDAAAGGASEAPAFDADDPSAFLQWSWSASDDPEHVYVWPRGVAPNIVCRHCVHPFAGPPFSIPTRYENGQFVMQGAFCSVTCARSHVLTTHMGEQHRIQLLDNIAHFVSRVMGRHDPGVLDVVLRQQTLPLEDLQCFGGRYDIETWRRLSQCIALAMQCVPPYIPEYVVTKLQGGDADALQAARTPATLQQEEQVFYVPDAPVSEQKAVAAMRAHPSVRSGPQVYDAFLRGRGEGAQPARRVQRR